MRREEVTALIIDIEQRFPVDSWVINEIHVWPLIRIPLAMKLYCLDDLVETAETSEMAFLSVFKRRVKKILSFINAYVRDFKNNDRINGKIDAIFLSNTICRSKLGNVWYDRICEPFYEDLTNKGLKCIIFECTNDYNFRIPRAHKSVFVQPELDYLEIISRTKSANSEPGTTKFAGWENLFQYLENKGISTLLPTKNEIKRMVQNIEQRTYFFIDILKKRQPRMGFVECYYDNDGFALNRACRHLRIPTIDIQHGVQGYHHIAYGNWTRVPINGYELLPDFFWCWSEYEAQAINSWSEKYCRHKAIIGGNLWLNKWIHGQTAIMKKYDNIIKGLVNKKDHIMNILLTLQPNLFPEQWILDTIERSPSNWMWWIRLHPGMMHSREEIRAILLRDCSKGNWELDQASDLPLYSWLRHIDVHVTQSSTVVLEAKTFGVPSVITHPNGEIYLEQIGTEIVNVAYSVSDLIEAIQKATIQGISGINKPARFVEPIAVYNMIMTRENETEQVSIL